MDFFESKALNRCKKSSISVELHRISIYAIYNTKKVCLCLCVCLCVRVCECECVCEWCVCDVCERVSECVCVVFYCYA